MRSKFEPCSQERHLCHLYRDLCGSLDMTWLDQVSIICILSSNIPIHSVHYGKSGHHLTLARWQTDLSYLEKTITKLWQNFVHKMWSGILENFLYFKAIIKQVTYKWLCKSLEEKNLLWLSIIPSNGVALLLTYWHRFCMTLESQLMARVACTIYL